MKIEYLGYDYLNKIRFIRQYDKGVYRCVICGERVTLEESYSCAGHKLICINCKYKHFKTTDDMFKWLDEE